MRANGWNDRSIILFANNMKENLKLKCIFNHQVEKTVIRSRLDGKRFLSCSYFICRQRQEMMKTRKSKFWDPTPTIPKGLVVFFFFFFFFYFSFFISFSQEYPGRVNDHTVFHSQVASSLLFSSWSQTLYESSEPLNVTALGDRFELMRQSFVSQVSCKDFVFSGKMGLSSEILAKSFVFPALFSSLLPLWPVSGKWLLNCCLLTPLCTVCTLLLLPLLGSCYIWQVAMPVPAWWTRASSAFGAGCK